MNITEENIEEQILLLVDGELDAAAEEELMAYIGRYPRYRAMLDAYLATQLAPEAEIRFPGKEALLKPEQPGIIPFRKRTFTVARAAALAALFCLTIIAVLLFRNKEANIPELAAGSGKEQIRQSQAPPVKKAPATITVAVAKHEKAAKPIKPSRQTAAFSAPAPRVIVQAVQEPETGRQENIVPVTLAIARTLAVAQPLKAVAVAGSETLIAAAAEENDPAVLGPVNEEKLQGLNDLVSRVQHLKENVQEKARSLKGTIVVLRWGNKELALGK